MDWERKCKEELDAVVQDHFPEPVIGRGDALAIYATAMSLLHKTIKGFGGCTHCWGKGYGTQTLNYHAAADFEGDQTHDTPAPVMDFCPCPRGQQLKKHLER